MTQHPPLVPPCEHGRPDTPVPDRPAEADPVWPCDLRHAHGSHDDPDRALARALHAGYPIGVLSSDLVAFGTCPGVKVHPATMAGRGTLR